MLQVLFNGLANAKGGILGREIALHRENSETNPETAIRAARKLVDVNKVIGVLGTWSSSATLGIMPLCQEASVIQMCTSSSANIPLKDKKLNNDFTSVYKELFRQGYEGKVITVSISTGSKFKKVVGAAADGILHGLPVPSLGSVAYKDYLKLVGLKDTGAIQHPFGTAGHDQMSVLLLGVASAGTDDATKVREHIHKIANAPGMAVTNVLDGLAALEAGEEINFARASSDVNFKPPSGVLKSRDFVLWEIKDGKDIVVETIASAS